MFDDVSVTHTKKFIATLRKNISSYTLNCLPSVYRRIIDVCEAEIEY